MSRDTSLPFSPGYLCIHVSMLDQQFTALRGQVSYDTLLSPF